MKNYERGSVLIIVLVLMTVMIALSTYIVALSNQTTSNASALIDKLNCKLEAGSQLEIAKFVLASGRFDASFARVSLPDKEASAATWPLNGEPIEKGNHVLQLWDTGGRLSLEWVYPQRLSRMLVEYGMNAEAAVQVADGLMDWVDPDDFKHLNGAEINYYLREKKYGYKPRNNGAIQAPEELILIRGWPAKFEMPQFTLYGGTRFNVNTADVPTLAAVLGVTETMAKSLETQRKARGWLNAQEIAVLTGIDVTGEFSGLTITASEVVDLTLTVKSGKAREVLRAQIDFRPGSEKPFFVTRYWN
jgi:type II secretory pathway component PulK